MFGIGGLALRVQEFLVVPKRLIMLLATPQGTFVAGRVGHPRHFLFQMGWLKSRRSGSRAALALVE